ncbi:hypothetical protein [Rhizobium sp. BK602]|uniref:hypothetical protein n=1 Tax=Rhizobium sp. BK602 TaxID=2586986 RepID=UPI001613B120|nr:hypothetical protein [Rhizobium sp. BK602]MBB3610233.1 hypothetical protein [Rhizobium sp. BK602]
MIVIVEGISAAGKTSWYREHALDLLVPETYPQIRPDRNRDARKAAQLWTDWNIGRWSEALAQEESKGVAICDTDPLKLHYIWSLWRIGEAPENHWRHQMEVTRAAFGKQALGFADLYLVKKIDPHSARLQREQDQAKSRMNFDLHVRLQPSLHAWYETLATLLPERVQSSLPTPLPAFEPGAGPFERRYDVELFDRFIANLPGQLSSKQ